VIHHLQDITKIENPAKFRILQATELCSVGSDFQTRK